MRIAAWLAIDCVIPFGPQALGKMLDAIQDPVGRADESDEMFDLRRFLPGDGVEDQQEAGAAEA